MADPVFNHLVVEGPIGVGKSRLAAQLAERLDAELLLEQSTTNPFLERFYQNPREGALATQLHFLLERAEELSQIRQSDLFAPRYISDFLFAKDRLFAALNLDDAELALYERIWSVMAPQVSPPDLVVYLQAPVDVLQARLRRYGGALEAQLDTVYLERLANAYIDFFHDYDESPVLIVNSTGLNPLASDQHLNVLVGEMSQIGHGRHYFNPAE